MAVDLARYVVSLEAQTAKYVQELDKANRKLDRFHKDQQRAVAKIKTAFVNLGVTLASALSVTAIVNFTKASVQMADQLGETARAAGTSARTLQELRFAFDQLGGIASGETDQGLQRFNRTLGLAINGSRQAEQQFRLLGVAFKDSLGRGRGTDETLESVLKALGEIENDAQRAAIAGRLFGQEMGPKLAAALKGGSDALDQARAQVVGIISDESVRKAEALDDAFKRMAATISGPLRQAAIGAAFELAKITGQAEEPAIDILNAKIAKTKDEILRLQSVLTAQQSERDNVDFLERLFGMDEAEWDQRMGETRKQLDQLTQNLRVFEAAADQTGSAVAQQFVAPLEHGMKRIGDLIDQFSHLGAKRPNIEMDFLDEFEEIVVKAKPLSMDDLIQTIDPAEVRRLFEPINNQAEETAKYIGSTFQDAFADWILGTERSFGELLKRMAAQLATSALFRTLGSLFPGGSFFSNFFGGGRAEGGPVSAGKGYIVGERGPEWFMPGISGAIIPNGGGGLTYNDHTMIDARGVDPSLISRLPAILAAHKREVMAEIQDKQRRGRF